MADALLVARLGSLLACIRDQVTEVLRDTLDPDEEEPPTADCLHGREIIEAEGLLRQIGLPGSADQLTILSGEAVYDRLRLGTTIRDAITERATRTLFAGRLTRLLRYSETLIADLARAYPGLNVPSQATANTGLPPTANPEQGEADGGTGLTTPANTTEADLEPADRKAYYSYSWAEGRLLEAGATRVKDREAYDWLKDNGLPDEKDLPQLATEFAGYKLPAFDTWVKQVRKARKALGTQKYQKRAGRKTGRSIAGGREIEHQGADDD